MSIEEEGSAVVALSSAGLKICLYVAYYIFKMEDINSHTELLYYQKYLARSLKIMQDLTGTNVQKSYKSILAIS